MDGLAHTITHLTILIVGGILAAIAIGIAPFLLALMISSFVPTKFQSRPWLIRIGIFSIFLFLESFFIAETIGELHRSPPVAASHGAVRAPVKN